MNTTTRHLFGFGGVKIATGARTCNFPFATGQLAFDPVNIINETASFDKRYRFCGWRAVITVEITNACVNDFDEFRKLPMILNDMNAGLQLTVYPHFNATDDNLGYVCRSDSRFMPEQLARTKIGQKVTLEFESVSLVRELPSLASDPDTYNWITQAGDEIITQAGDNIVFSE